MEQKFDRDPELAVSSNTPTQPGTMPGIMPDEDTFGRLILFLKKRAWIMVVGVTVGYLCGVAANHLMQRLYTAQATIEISGQDTASQFRLEQIPDLASDDSSMRLDTEIEILRSRNLAFETIRTLHLEKNPDFLPFSDGHPWDISRPDDRQTLIRTFLGDIAVSRLGHTSIIQIFVTSPRPELATLIANTLVDRYIEHSFRENYASTNKVSEWLDSQLDQLKANLEKSQTNILELQRDIGVYGLDQSHSIVAANLEELNRKYADAQVERLLKEAHLQEIKSSSPEVIDAALGSMDPAIQSLKQRLAQLNSEYTSLSQTYGNAYPRVKSLKAQIDQIQRELRTGENAQVARSQKDFEAALDSELKLRTALEQQEQEAFSKGGKAMQYEFARQDYQANRLLYNGLQQRLQEASIIAGLHATPIHILDIADTPVFWSRPRTKVNQAIGAGIGLLIGMLLAVILEAIDTNLKTIHDIEQGLQLPLLGAIPTVSADQLLPATFQKSAMTRDVSRWSRIAESFRAIRTSILLSSPGSPPKVIMIASTRPTEGKTSIAALMAITLAMNGSKVFLVDGDLRRPAIHLRFKVAKGLGLSSVLSGKATLEEALVAWPELPNLHILPSGPVPPLPSELLGSKQMEDLLTQMRALSDVIIIDTPPVLAVTDASILGRLADATILVVRYGTANKQVVLRCLDLLERSGAHLLGVAVNAVDLESPEYAEYYGRKYYEYYGGREPE